MLYNAKNGTLKIGGTTMDYIRFGTGERILVMLPGLGDGLRSMKGTALPMAFMYREFAKDFTVYAFSRKNVLPEGYTTRDMARDLQDAKELEVPGTPTLYLNGTAVQLESGAYSEIQKSLDNALGR